MILCALPVAASAAESRAALTVSAYVAVAGSVAVTASSVETPPPPRKSSSSLLSPDTKFGSCASVALMCAGPKSMRVKLHTQSDMLMPPDHELSKGVDSADLCSAGAGAGNGIAMCSAQAADLSVLGVTVDY